MGRKASKVVEAPRRRKLNLSLEDGVHGRLCAYAAFHRREISAVVAEAVEAYMVGFTVYQRSQGGTQVVPPALPLVEEGPRLAS